MNYQEFLETKKLLVKNAGLEVSDGEINSNLFPFQHDLVKWSLRKGRSAIFADTGLGKTRMQLAWAEVIYKRLDVLILILAPLAVARQTVVEGQKMGIDVKYVRNQDQITSESGIYIANYEMLSHFDPARFGAVVLDESSILKSFEGKVRTQLIKTFQNTPMRLCCTATPAPNDISEIANHAEFLGIMTRVEMLAAFFVHDDNGWRLKGHARKPFYKWLASWGMSIRKPSDLNYSDEGYDLPGLEIKSSIVKTDYVPEGQMFAVSLKGVGERATVRKSTLTDRTLRVAELIQADAAEQWIVWCGLNDESKALAKLIPDSIEVEGSQSPEEKTARIEKFLNGDVQVLITKVSIAGFGLNLQQCARMIFCGMSDSYEQYYQAIRRCYRFGQKRIVEAFIVLSELEETIYYNVLKKEQEAKTMASELIQHIGQFEKAELGKGKNVNKLDYTEKDTRGQDWTLMLGDSAERLKELPDNSVDLSVFSEPFASLYTYTNSERDLGNCKDYNEFWTQFSFITSELFRVMKPGRLIAAHVQQLPLTKNVDGVIGMKDFRGDNIRHFTEQGFIYHGEVCIDKDPQAQAIRTKNKGLLFVQLHKDSSWSRPAFADYILLFRKPGDNAVPITPDVSNNEWIEFARPIWYGIKESNTLNAAEARSHDDERHICPLQLGAIERCIRLWSNRGETVLTPFAGIGSEVYEAVRLGRKGIGIELNPVYYKVAVKNVQNVERQTVDLFSFAGLELEA